MRKKLHSHRGETLVETLAAILILTLASIVLLTQTLAAVRINRGAAASDTAFQEELQAVERQENQEERKQTVTVGPYSYGVTLYGKGDQCLTAYGLTEQPGGAS